MRGQSRPVTGGSLNTTTERLEDGRVKLTVTVPAVDVDIAIDKAYRDIAGKLRIPGFRKGKIPRPIIDTHVGREAVLAEAQESLVEGTYPLAIDAEELRPVEAPDMGELDGLIAGEDFTYSADIIVRPEFTLSSLDGLTIAAGPSETTEREIDAQIEHHRERFATLEPVDRPVELGDFVLLSFVGTVDGETYDGNTVDRYLYETQRGLMPEEFDAALVGAKPGDKVVAEFEIPDTSSNDEFVGKTARFEIEVHEVKAKVLPDVDDAFAASVGGFDTLAEFREDIRTKFNESKAAGRAQRVEMLALDLLASRLVGDVPEAMVRNRASSLTRDFFESLDERKITLEEYVNATGVPVEKIQADLEEQARQRIREELALEALFRAKDMTVGDSEFEAALLGLAGGDVMALDEVRQSVREAGATPIIKESLVHQQALSWLLDNIVVTEDEPGEAPVESKPAKKRASKKKATSSKEE